MLLHPLRRLTAACASILLVLGLIGVTSSPSQAEDPVLPLMGGMVKDAEGAGLANITINIYRSTGNPDAPWTLEGSQLTRSDGRYSARLPAGTYRIMFNEFDDGTAAWTTWRPTPWSQVVSGAEVTEFTTGPNLQVDYTETVMHPRGGELRGTITASYGRPMAGVDILLFDAAGNGEKPLGTKVKTASDGTYSIRLSTRPTKAYIQVNGRGPRFVSRWIGPGSTFEDAKTFTLTDGEVSEGNDAVVTYVEPASLSGRVLDPEGKPIVHASIKIFKSRDGVGAPWDYLNTAHTRSPNNGFGPEFYGTFSTQLDPGRYRIRFEPFYEQGGLLQATYYGDATTIDEGTSIDHGGTDQTLPDATLGYSGGIVSGRVTDTFNKPLANVRISSHLSDSTWPMAGATSDARGEYTIRVSSDPTTLDFSTSMAANFHDSFVRDLTVPTGETMRTDVKMTPKPISMASSPRVYGSLNAGRTLKTTGGTWRPTAVTKKYRWYYLKGGKIRPIAGATRSYLGLRKTDYGKRFRVRVTASHPGVASRVVTSAWSGTLMRNSSMSLSGSSPSRGKIKLTAKVNVSGAKATGKVKFSCGTPAATFTSKTVSLKSEKASVKLSTTYSTRMTCRADYRGNSSTKKTSRSKGITVK